MKYEFMRSLPLGRLCGPAALVIVVLICGCAISPSDDSASSGDIHIRFGSDDDGDCCCEKKRKPLFTIK